MKTLKEQLAAAERELALRSRVYPGQVSSLRMSKAKMEHELGCMEAIITTLQRLIYLEEVSNDILGKQSEQVDLI